MFEIFGCLREIHFGDSSETGSFGSPGRGLRLRVTRVVRRFGHVRRLFHWRFNYAIHPYSGHGLYWFFVRFLGLVAALKHIYMFASLVLPVMALCFTFNLLRLDQH